MRLLVLGGTQFVGRWFVQAALAAGLTLRPLEDSARDTWAWMGAKTRA